MTTIDVLPASLVAAAAAVRCFSAEIDPVVSGSTGLGSGVLGSEVLGSEVLGSALADFSARWARALEAVVDDADVTAAALRDAAARYADLDRLLIPRALR